jgi:hypothetical protein
MNYAEPRNSQPDNSDANQTLKNVIKEARQAITEGRDAVQGLRSSTVVTNELARARSACWEKNSLPVKATGIVPNFV